MRVLVVEPQAAVAASLKRTLRAEDFVVDLARSANQAQDLTRTVKYDLVVLSLELPDEESFSLICGWRIQGMNVPTLAVAGPDRLDDKIRALECGADHALGRPFAAPELAAHLRALARRVHRRYDQVLRVHDLEIDTSTRSVKRAGQSIRLTRREYTLLQFLAVHQGRVVSRSMISEHLYPESDGNHSNVVDVFIRCLRRKIDKGFDPPLILTRWGQGYLLRGEEDPPGRLSHVPPTSTVTPASWTAACG